MKALIAPLLARWPLQDQWLRLRRELGRTGFLALAALACTAVFYKVALEPLQTRAALLSSQLARQASPAAAGGGDLAGKLETFYSHLNRPESTTDWLAKLYAIGKATGVELQSGTYRSPGAAGAASGSAAADANAGRIERYEIVLPVSGSYVQMRDFLNRALGEIPVLSLDQLTLKRESRNDGAVQAELKLTLHRVKP